MKKPWVAIRNTGVVVILVATIACLGVMAVSASMASMQQWPSFVFIPEEDTSLYRKGTTWGPWMQATSCPLGLSGSERWGTARVRCGHIVRDREVMTFWEVDGQRKLICNISSSPRVDVYLWAGGVTAGMGIVWVLLWYNVATRLGKDRAPTTDGREDALVRTRANACLVVLHFASIMVCLLGIRILWLEVPSGEGWWFTRTHTGAMWLASIMANAAAGYLVLTRKRQSISLTALSILGLLTPVAPALARPKASA